jgi:hypothetical protein
MPTSDALLLRLLLLPASAAAVGWAFGRLIRVPIPKSVTPRTQPAREYLVACFNPRIGLQERLLNAFESAYFCCVDVAAWQGITVDNVDHPDRAIVEQALPKLQLQQADRERVLALLDWRLYAIPSNPAPCSQDEAVSLARNIYSRTVKLVSPAGKAKHAEA